MSLQGLKVLLKGFQIIHCLDENNIDLHTLSLSKSLLQVPEDV